MDRRDILKLMTYTGATLPFVSISNPLQAMPLNSTTSVNKVSAKKNLVIITNEFGFWQGNFYPEKDDLNSSKLVSLLKPYHEDITVFNQITQKEIGPGHGNHKGLLTLNTNQRVGPYISLDQFAIERLKQESRFKSVHMGEYDSVWDRNSRKVPSIYRLGPSAIYKKLFTRESSSEELQKKLNIFQAYKSNLPKNSYKFNNSFAQAIKELEEEIATDVIWEKKPIPEVHMDTQLHLADHHGRGFTPPPLISI